MQIEKVLDTSTRTNEYTFTKDNLEFKIFFGGNLDLYWQIIDKTVAADNMFDYENKPLEFVIDEENMEVYLLFLKLYNDIINRIFGKTEENLYRSSDKVLESAYSLLVKDGVISWHSDETNYEEANILNIELVGKNIKLTFIKQFETDYSFPGDISIRFRNNGSTYAPFNRQFMAHFNALANVSTEEHENKQDNQEKKLTSQPKTVDQQ